jgi:tetratricopeptide (TPR) repeat protein
MRSFQLIILLLFLSNCENKITKKPEVNEVEELKRKAEESYSNSLSKNAAFQYSQLLKYDSANSEYYYKRGISYSQLNKDDLAVLDFRKSIEQNYRVYDSFYILGVIYGIKLHNDSLAKHYLRKALTIYPESNEAQELLNALLEDSLRMTQNETVL